MDELQHLADEVKRDVEPYDRWWKAKLKEWEKKGWDNWTEEGHRLIELETSSAEYRTRFDKKRELEKRSSEANTAHIRAELELEFAEEVLEAARTEDLARIVERAALIRRIQKEVRFAEFHVEEEKESRRVLDLKWGVLDNLYSIPRLKGKMKRHNILLNWVEQQRRGLIGDNANAERESGPRRSKRVSPRAHPSPRVIKASIIDHAAKKRARPQERSRAKSILDPVDPGKVTKASRQKKKCRRRTSLRAIPRGRRKKRTSISKLPSPKATRRSRSRMECALVSVPFTLHESSSSPPKNRPNDKCHVDLALIIHKNGRYYTY